MMQTFSSDSPRAPRAITWLTALLVVLSGALVVMLVRGGSRPAEPVDVASALAGGVVSQTGGLVALTTDAGNEDLLLILDTRNEEMFVYRTDQKTGLGLLQRYAVPQLFTDARARSAGKP